MTVRFRSKNTASFALVPPPTDHDTGLRRTAAVQRRLAAAAAAVTDEELVQGFIDTMSVQEDELRGWGYAESIQGAYELQIVSDGADRAAAPAALWLENEADDAVLFRLAPQDIDRLEFRDCDDIVAARVGERGVRPWLVVLSGVVRRSDEPRLGLCMDLLDQALKASARRAAARLRWAILEHLLSSTGRTRSAAEAALGALGAAAGAAGAALVVTTSNGVHVFSAGHAEAFSLPAHHGDPADMVTTATIVDQYSVTLAMRRTARVAFTGRDRYLLDVAAPLFATWLSGVLRPSLARGDDRRAVTAC